MERVKPDSMLRKPFKDGSSLRSLVEERIGRLDIRPNENLGQHFLVDQVSIDLLVSTILPGATVLEVGAGIGQLTEALARKATRVVSVEIDRRYKPILSQITDENPNVNILYADALTLKTKDILPKKKDNPDLQIIASLPFHITEPFFHMLLELPIDSAVLVVGQRLAYSIKARGEDGEGFGQLTLLAQTFFDIEVLSKIGRQQFYPVPRTDSAIVRLMPKDKREIRANKRSFLFSRLFLTARRSPLVKNTLREGLIEFAQLSKTGTLSKSEYHRRERNQTRSKLKGIASEYNYAGGKMIFTEDSPGSANLMTQNQARQVIAEMNIPSCILDKPFEQLNNSELRVLSHALKDI